LKMKKTNHQRTNIMTIRLTALLVAVVFVVGTMLVPAELYAAESETGEAQAAAVEETATEPAGAAAEETEPVLTDESEAEAVDAVEPEATEAVAEESEETEETEETVQNDLSEALAVDLDRIDEDAYDGFIYKLEDSTTNKEIKEMETAIEELPQEQTASVVVDKEVYAADSIETIAEVADPSMIEYIEPDYIVNALGTDDVYYDDYGWYLDMINAPYVWDQGVFGAGATVAVLDSGVNKEHEDLKDTNYSADQFNAVNAVNNTGNTRDVADDFGHGTKVTGVIAASYNNGKGLTGVMPESTIMPVKVLDKTGSGKVSYIIKGIDFAISKKADVINMSFGGAFSGEWSINLENALKRAKAAGIILVAAAGNDGLNTAYYPASYDCVVSVGSVGPSGNHSSFSNYNKYVAVSAPGEYLCMPSLKTYKDCYGNYVYYTADTARPSTSSGTSFATPQVAAMAAMFKSLNIKGSKTAFNQDAFMSILRASSTDCGSRGYDIYYGYGLIDFEKAFEYVNQVNVFTVNLSSTVYDYNGSVKTPAVTLMLGAIKLIKDEDYTVTYSSGRTAVGTYKITVEGINDYSGTKTTSFQIRPPLVKSIKAPKRGKKKLTVRWKAMSSSQKSKYKSAITGYQVRVARKANFSNAKYKKVKGISKTSVTVKGLKKKKTYYVQYRSYKVVGSTTYYSKWSGKKKAKTK